MVRNPTRREFAVAVGGIVGGVAVTSTGSEPASAAQVEMDGLDIPDANHVGEVNDITLYSSAEVGWESNADIGGWTLRMDVGRSEDDLERLDFALGSNPAASGTATRELSGSLLELDAFRPELFAAESEVTTVEIVARLGFELTDTAGEVIAGDSVQTTATITVEPEHMDVSVSLGGEGEIEIQ